MHRFTGDIHAWQIGIEFLVSNTPHGEIGDLADTEDLMLSRRLSERLEFVDLIEADHTIGIDPFQ